MRKASLLFTQVADAMTIRPVARSTAITDHVACAAAGKSTSSAPVAIALRVRGKRITSPSLEWACGSLTCGGRVYAATCFHGWRRAVFCLARIRVNPMRINLSFAGAAAALTVLSFPAALDAQRSVTAPARLGFAADRLARIDRFMQQAVDSNRIAGAVLLVMRDGQVAYERAFGWADREAGRRMTTDAIFRIASQSKALTSAALLSLVEEGKAAVTDPVSRYIPTFAQTRVVMRTDTGPALVPAKRAITLADLLTHTAGISYGTDALVASAYSAKGLGPAAGFGWYTADKDEPICDTMQRLGTLPFVAH